MSTWTEGLTFAGRITAVATDQIPVDAPVDRARHAYGNGPFAVLRMPPLPDEPGLYVWCADGVPVYVGQTRGALRARLGPNGYSTISTYNTFARQPGRRNGGQQTNCRVNAPANLALRDGHELTLSYRVTGSLETLAAEADWMRLHCLPAWNRQDRR